MICVTVGRQAATCPLISVRPIPAQSERGTLRGKSPIAHRPLASTGQGEGSTSAPASHGGLLCWSASPCSHWVMSWCRRDAAFQWTPNMRFHLPRSEEHTSELQSLRHLVCRLLL